MAAALQSLDFAVSIILAAHFSLAAYHPSSLANLQPNFCQPSLFEYISRWRFTRRSLKKKIKIKSFLLGRGFDLLAILQPFDLGVGIHHLTLENDSLAFVHRVARFQLCQESWGRRTGKGGPGG